MKAPRILVLRGGAIGDFICTLPALAALRRRWPEAHVELVGYPRIASLALEGRLVDSVLSLDRAEVAQYFSANPQISDAHAEWIRSFDVVISYLLDPSDTVRVNLLSFGARRVIYCSPKVEERHAVNQLFQAVEKLGIVQEKAACPRLQLTQEPLRVGHERVRKIGDRVMAIHPGSGSRLKNWPLERFVDLAERMQSRGSAHPVFIVGEAEQELVHELTTGGSDISLIGGHDLLDVAGVLSACVGYVGNDSGITHLAAAVGIPVVAIYGPTNPALWGPRGKQVRIIAATEGNGQKLASISVDRVLSALP